MISLEGRIVTEPENAPERTVPGVSLADTVAESHDGGSKQRTYSTNESVFELEDVTVSYGGKPAVSEV